MGFGITGFIKAATQKALIRYVDPDSEEAQKQTLESEPEGYLKSIYSSYKQEFLGILQEIRPDVKKAESHRYQSEVTQYAVEDGTIFSQHVIQRPIKVTLQFEETNAGKMVQNIISTAASWITGSKKKTMFEQLVEIWERKIPVEIVTDQKIYKNMVIENLPIMHKAPYKGALQVMVDFVQLSTFQIQIDEKKGATQSITKAANKVKSIGKQAIADIKSNPTAEQIADAQRRVSNFKAEDMYKYSQERISQQREDVAMLQKLGYM